MIRSDNMLRLFDSHAHPNEDGFSPEERAQFIEKIDKAVENGDLSFINDIGFNLESSVMAAEHAKLYPWCHAVVGLHPHEADSYSDEQLEKIAELAKQPKVVAIGEIGLDFHYDNSDRDAQRYWFRRQIRLANELSMPIVIHERDAGGEVMEILKEEGAFDRARADRFPNRPGRLLADGSREELPDARVLLHCFSGSAEFGRQYVELGATLSIAGPVTYKNARKTIEVAQQIPLEFLLVETDAPYLSPVPHRGEQNHPVNVIHTAAKVAEIKGIDIETVAEATRNNAKRFFGIE